MSPQPNKILGRFVEKCSSDGSTQTAIGPGDQNDPGTHSILNRAAMACSFGPTTLTVALRKRFRSSDLTAPTHCQAAAAISPSPRIRFGENRGPFQSFHAFSSA